MSQMPSAIDRVEAIDFPDFVRAYQNRLRPVVLSSLCRHWPAHAKWSSELFRNQFGGRMVTFAGASRPMSEFLDLFDRSSAQAPSPYLRECYLEKAFPELLADVTPIPGNHRNRLSCHLVPGWRGRRFGTAELLMAGAGARFPVLHYDIHHYHAFITQIRGDKRFFAFDPGQTAYMYPRAENANLSQIDHFDPVDLERFPLFRHARAAEVIVHPGETIFVPSGWWHRTEILSGSIAVTWNSVSRVNWPSFIDDAFTARSLRMTPLKRTLKIAYFATLGSVLTASERVGWIP